MPSIQQEKDLALIIYQPEKITNPRIRQLVEASGDLTPFDDLPELVETFDESTQLSSRHKFCLPEFYPVTLEHQSEYLLIYYDGQIVEVSDVKTQEIVFRNITACCYQRINYKHDWTPFSQQEKPID
jgi:hypothetical protein